MRFRFDDLRFRDVVFGLAAAGILAGDSFSSYRPWWCMLSSARKLRVYVHNGSVSGSLAHVNTAIHSQLTYAASFETMFKFAAMVSHLIYH